MKIPTPTLVVEIIMPSKQDAKGVEGPNLLLEHESTYNASFISVSLLDFAYKTIEVWSFLCCLFEHSSSFMQNNFCAQIMGLLP